MPENEPRIVADLLLEAAERLAERAIAIGRVLLADAWADLQAASRDDGQALRPHE